MDVSTHSRLKAAGEIAVNNGYIGNVSTHSRLKAAGLDVYNRDFRFDTFQHTAA